ncbi:alpha/beta fold hydrolase [Thermomonospora amylolytica]|uniref:alpha/beta fold hydrolase n=1 Tax=Thermomonospora amylolytica TaxID=1411117 RepID=UPI000E6C4C0C|nr:alpha/beta fold hydrolase [Thermomonospora amylolytica]
MGEFVDVGGTGFWVEQRGRGPDVLLIAGLGDSAEVWQAQLDGLADRYRVTAFDNRGVGRTPMPEGGVTVPMMADDAAGVLRALGVPAAHVAGFSGGSVIAQELALGRPEVVRSLVLVSTWARPDPYFLVMTRFWRWMVAEAPDPREALEAFYLWIYTRRAHADGTVDRLVEEVLAFPHQQAVEDFQRQLDAFRTHETLDRLGEIRAPTLVLAGEQDLAAPPHLGRVAAEAIPGAGFEVLPGEAHQPFQEVPEMFNDRVDAFWRQVEAHRGGTG